MQAFPKDSANNTLGGSGPVNKYLDMDRIHGRETEGYADFNRATDGQTRRKFSFEKERPTAFDPFSRTDLVHGEESTGLGTSTFFEGTTASKSALRQRSPDADTTYASSSGGGGPVGGGAAPGLARKKSLAQRLRGMSAPRRPPEDFPTSLNANMPGSPDSPPSGARKGSVPNIGVRTLGPPASASSILTPQSAGGRLGAEQGDTNPFFNDYDEAYVRKGASIRVAEQETQRPRTRDRAPSSPGRGPALTRRVTTDCAADEGSGGGLARTGTGESGVGAPGAGGLLGRMKSLKKGKPRARGAEA